MLTSLDPRSICPDASAPVSLAPPQARLTTTAWSPQRQLTVADWVRQGRWLGALGRGSGWWIGDWIRYGNARYGERYGRAAQVTGYDVHSLRNMAYVAGHFDMPRRRQALSFSHHAELASLTVQDQELWLDRAEAGAMSVRSLRSELRHARQRAASRAALAEARGRPDEAVTSIRSNGAAFAAEFEAPEFATSSQCNGGTSTAVSHEVVCPKCGCHFAPVAPVLRSDSVAS
jgi:hypothetical protein